MEAAAAWLTSAPVARMRMRAKVLGCMAQYLRTEERKKGGGIME